MIDVDLGPRLREARRLARLSVRALAADVGVSGAMISQIENGRTQPSVTTLYALVERLGVSLDWLTGRSTPPAPESPAVRRADQHPVLHVGGGVRWELVSSIADGAVEAVLVGYDPEAASSADGTSMHHDGVESAYLFEGELTVELGDEEFVLRAGDSLVFDSTRPHRYVNHGTTTARGIWMNSGTPHPA